MRRGAAGENVRRANRRHFSARRSAPPAQADAGESASRGSVCGEHLRISDLTAFTVEREQIVGARLPKLLFESVVLIEGSLAMCTSLAPLIGYDKAAAIAKEAFATGKTVRQVALEQKVLSDAELNKALDPMSMTRPG